jgi:hypothetical protein
MFLDSGVGGLRRDDFYFGDRCLLLRCFLCNFSEIGVHLILGR